MSSLSNRTYAVVKWNPGFDRAWLRAFARDGGIQSVGPLSAADAYVVRNLAGTMAVVKWVGARPQGLAGNRIVFEGTRDEVFAYITDPGRVREWVASLEDDKVSFVAKMVSRVRAVPARTWGWLAGAAAAGAAAAWIVG